MKPKLHELCQNSHPNTYTTPSHTKQLALLNSYRQRGKTGDGDGDGDLDSA